MQIRENPKNIHFDFLPIYKLINININIILIENSTLLVNKYGSYNIFNMKLNKKKYSRIWFFVRIETELILILGPLVII